MILFVPISHEVRDTKLVQSTHLDYSNIEISSWWQTTPTGTNGTPDPRRCSALWWWMAECRSRVSWWFPDAAAVAALRCWMPPNTEYSQSGPCPRRAECIRDTKERPFRMQSIRLGCWTRHPTASPGRCKDFHIPYLDRPTSGCGLGMDLWWADAVNWAHPSGRLFRKWDDCINSTQNRWNSKILTQKCLRKILDGICNIHAGWCGQDIVQQTKMVVVQTSQFGLNWNGKVEWGSFAPSFELRENLQAAARVPMLMSWTLKLPVINDWIELLSFLEKILNEFTKNKE